MFNVIINSEQYDEFMSQKEKIKELEGQVDDWKMQFESTYKNYQQVLSDKAALIEERNNLRIKNNELENKVIRFKELVTENYRLKMSINDLKANNKELKAKIKEPVAAITINPCRDSDEEYSPDNNTNIKIENLYITNNYFSEEDENNERQGFDWHLR